ncbi:MAG: TIGR02391 family protein [Alphaproteobacteria bacterium]|nr:TIGR02391 family protein [Alphaproteobacteria bacterium]
MTIDEMKGLYATEEKDGSSLMGATIFSLNNLLLKFENKTIETSKSIEDGYMQIFAGAMTAIRNPKAYENQTIPKEAAIKRLIFASLLMDKIDKAVNYSNINERL